ncbi:hypothetical protein [Streptomyces sp. NPDC057257]|uniref:hypothetical protein n=1 Tax=Streptomyces sp. NPDC057257 TaxID=3346071 RepID=UPI00363FC94F
MVVGLDEDHVGGDELAAFDLGGCDRHEQQVRLGDSLVEDAVAAAGLDHDRAEFGALCGDVLGDVVEGVLLDHQVGGDLEALGLGDLEPVPGGLAGRVGVQQQRRQPQDDRVDGAMNRAEVGLAGAAFEMPTTITKASQAWAVAAARVL